MPAAQHLQKFSFIFNKMIQKTRSNIIRSITSDELLCWIIKNGKTTLQEQNDESVSAQDSAAQLNEALDELEEESENGERVSITVSNKPLGFGRKLGSKMKCYDYALGSETALTISNKNTKISYTKEYLDMVKKLERLETEKKYQEIFNKMNESNRLLVERLDKLEKGNDESINGFTSLLNHPLALALISRYIPMPNAEAANSINGLPEDLDELKKIDPDVNKLISAVLVIAKNNPDTYFQTKKMIIASV